MITLNLANLTVKNKTPKNRPKLSIKNHDIEKICCSYKKTPIVIKFKDILNVFKKNKNKKKVFGDISTRAQKFIFEKVNSIMTTHGCRHKCIHCYTESLPPIKEKGNFINKMLFEDFKSLIVGFSEISKVNNLKKIKHNHLSSFYDSDCMTTVLKTKKGESKDFIDIANFIKNELGTTVIFDTAGWNVKASELQQRAEKYAQYFSTPKNMLLLNEFNISINPFHSIWAKSLELKRTNKNEKANKLQKIYIDRMANTLFTFTPLVKHDNFNIMARAFCDGNEKAIRGFTKADLIQINIKILKKLKKMYEEDFAKPEPQFIKNQVEIEQYMNQFKKKIFKIRTNLTIGGNLEKNFYQDKFINKQNMKELIGAKSAIKYFLDNPLRPIIAANGDIYLSNNNITYKTELKLNFINKYKQTAPVGPDLQPEIITKKVLEDFLKSKEIILEAKQ